MALDKCPTCGEYLIFPRGHRCKPVFEVARGEDYDPEDPEIPDSIGEIRAADEEEAVINYSDARFSVWDYPVWDYPKSFEIVVRKQGESAWTKYEVEVEPVPSFTATKKEQKPCQSRS